jgi:predicted nuclease of restriction endonuclease-like (RecB) superfamily
VLASQANHQILDLWTDARPARRPALFAAIEFLSHQFVQEPLAQLTWYHNLTLLEKVKDREERLWYARQSIQNAWSRNVLVMHIEGGLYRRQGKAITNFQATLPNATF